MSDEFVLYVNHPRSYTMIHTTYCGYYVNFNQKDQENGKWSDRFKALKDAKDSAKKEQKKKNHYFPIASNHFRYTEDFRNRTKSSSYY